MKYSETFLLLGGLNLGMGLIATMTGFQLGWLSIATGVAGLVLSRVARRMGD